MGIINTFKKFLTNKTTVTIIGVVAGVAVLVGFYLYRVNQEVNPREVIVATRTIAATEEITRDDIRIVQISNSFLSGADVYTASQRDSLVGKYVNTGTSIPAGGMFYTSQIVEKEELPNSIFDEIPDGYTIYQLRVNNESTYANSIYPGDHIDLWMSTTQDGLVYYGEFISNIEVLAVRDSNGENVFAVPTDMYRYLKVAEFISGITITPLVRNTSYNSDVGSTEITNEVLLQMIQSRMIDMGGNYGG